MNNRQIRVYRLYSQEGGIEDASYTTRKVLTDIYKSGGAAAQLVVVGDTERLDDLARMFDDTEHLAVKVAIIKKMRYGRSVDGGPFDTDAWLASIAGPDSAPEIQEAAANRVIDIREELEDARNRELSEAVDLAVRSSRASLTHSRLESHRLQEEIWMLSTSVFPEVRGVAAATIEDQDRLNVMATDECNEVRRKVAERTDSKGILRLLAEDKDEYVAAKAKARLAE